MFNRMLLSDAVWPSMFLPGADCPTPGGTGSADFRDTVCLRHTFSFSRPACLYCARRTNQGSVDAVPSRNKGPLVSFTPGLSMGEPTLLAFDLWGGRRPRPTTDGGGLEQKIQLWGGRRPRPTTDGGGLEQKIQLRTDFRDTHCLRHTFFLFATRL